MTRPHLRSTKGQAAIEVVAFLPLLVAVAVAILAVLSAGAAQEAADAAAHSAAVAMAEGRDPKPAVRDALHDFPRSAAHVRLSPERVIVTVTQRMPVVPLPLPMTATTRLTVPAPPAGAPSRGALPTMRGGDGTGSRPGAVTR
jgi:hypothetical protein